MAEETKSPEILAIEKVSAQVEDFKKELGDRVGKEEFSKAEKALEDLKEGLNKMEEKKIDDTLATINGSITKFGEQLQEMQEELNQAKEGGRGHKKSGLIDTTDVSKFIENTFVENQKTRTPASVKFNGHIGDVRKAAENFGYPQFFEGATGTVSDAFTGRFIDPMLYQRRRKRNLILDNFPIETISVPKLLFLEKQEVSGDDASNEDTGGAAWIVSGGAKPQRSFRVGTGEQEAKKVAIFGTIEDKLLRDVSSLENWIREDFTDEMMETYNDGLLNNNPAVDADAPLGLKHNAIQYAATTAFATSISDANEIDAIIAAVAYMSTLKERPGRVFISDDLYYKILVLKGDDGHYQNKGLVYVSNQGQIFIGGVPLIPSDTEDVPSTHLLATSADMGFKIKNYQSMVFERGLNGTDFQHDRTSYRGYQEVLSYISQHRYNSVLYDTFANIIAAINATS